MSTSLAAVQIVFLLSGNGFQAVVPASSLQPSPIFANNQAGAVAGMEWISAKLPPERWMKDFDEAGFKDKVKPLILKDNAMRLLGLS